MKNMLDTLARRSFAASRLRNCIAVLAILLTAVLFTTVTTIAMGAVESMTLTMQMLKGSRSDGDIRNMTQQQFDALAEADVDFHEVIYRSSDNRRLNQVLNNLREQIYRYRVEYLKDEDTRKVLVKEHEEIYRAIKERDVKRAQEISYRHIENQREAIIRSIREEAANQEKSGNRK